MKTRSKRRAVDDTASLDFLSGVIQDVEEENDFDTDGEEVGNHCLRAEVLEGETEASVEVTFLSDVCGIRNELVTPGLNPPVGPRASQSSQSSQRSQPTVSHPVHTIHTDKLNSLDHKVQVENGSDDAFKLTLLRRETANLVKQMSMVRGLHDKYSVFGDGMKDEIKNVTPGEVAYQYLAVASNEGIRHIRKETVFVSQA